MIKSSALSANEISLLKTHGWEDYQLLDSGEGARLERFGPYIFSRPEHQAVWKRTLPEEKWNSAHAVFQPTGEESGGRWLFNKPIKLPGNLKYKGLSFLAFTANSRHLGVFPEQASHWDWISDLIVENKAQRDEPIKVLNLFGYTGLATLAAAKAGAQVAHVDASKKSILLARENQELSGLGGKPIRWLVDDAFKFVRKEARRGSKYDGIVLDPPKFGRGPQGQVWEFFEFAPGAAEQLPTLAQRSADFCRADCIRYPSIRTERRLCTARDGRRSGWAAYDG